MLRVELVPLLLIGTRLCKSGRIWHHLWDRIDQEPPLKESRSWCKIFRCLIGWAASRSWDLNLELDWKRENRLGCGAPAARPTYRALQNSEGKKDTSASSRRRIWIIRQTKFVKGTRYWKKIFSSKWTRVSFSAWIRRLSCHSWSIWVSKWRTSATWTTDLRRWGTWRSSTEWPNWTAAVTAAARHQPQTPAR